MEPTSSKSQLCDLNPNNSQGVRFYFHLYSILSHLLTERPALFTQDSKPERSFSMAHAHLLCSLSSELRYLCRASLQHASPQQKQSYGTTNKVITIFTKMGD